jgi:hypothetical protein
MLTNYWSVSIKEKGKYWCPECRSRQKEENKKRLDAYAVGYGTTK